MSKIKKKGIVFWITGLPGSGKTTIAKKIHNSIEDKFGPTIEISGDDLRKIFSFNKYDLKSRVHYAKTYSNLCQFLVKRKYNVLISTVSLFHEVHKMNRKNIKNYFEIFIQSNVKKIIRLNIKKTYKNKKNLMGLDLKPQFPKKPDIKIINSFNKSIAAISEDLLKKIFKKLN